MRRTHTEFFESFKAYLEWLETTKDATISVELAYCHTLLLRRYRQSAELYADPRIPDLRQIQRCSSVQTYRFVSGIVDGAEDQASGLEDDLILALQAWRLHFLYDSTIQLYLFSRTHGDEDVPELGWIQDSVIADLVAEGGLTGSTLLQVFQLTATRDARSYSPNGETSWLLILLTELTRRRILDPTPQLREQINALLLRTHSELQETLNELVSDSAGSGLWLESTFRP